MQRSKSNVLQYLSSYALLLVTTLYSQKLLSRNEVAF